MPSRAAAPDAGGWACRDLLADPDNRIAEQPSDFRKWERGYLDGRNAVAEQHGEAVAINPRAFPEAAQWEYVWQQCASNPGVPFADVVASIFRKLSDVRP